MKATLKRFVLPFVAVVFSVIGLGIGWFSKPTHEDELRKEQGEKAQIAKNLEDEKASRAECEKTRDDWKAQLSTSTSEKDKCLANYKERDQLLADKGAEMAMLYDSLGQVMEASSEQAEELICVQRGGAMANGECGCDGGTWDGAICVNTQMAARQQLCESGGGTWENQKCACGSGMMFSPEKGCVERPYPPTAQEEIAVLQKRNKKLTEERNLYEDSFSTCKAALKKPPKLTVQGAKIVSCTPGACSP